MIKRVMQSLKRPSKKSLGALLVVGFAAGVIFWGGFNWTLELTNTETFCISCHEMRDNPYQEIKDTIHYSNRTGVRATCPDCHVPKEWHYKIIRKIQASKELYGKATGIIDSREKYLDHRIDMARREWARMKKNDSRECRNCHNYDYMDFSEQGRRSSSIHEVAFEEGKTCIDCHKGIAHNLPPLTEDDKNGSSYTAH